jgi:hypothetical protein
MRRLCSSRIHEARGDERAYIDYPAFQQQAAA